MDLPRIFLSHSPLDNVWCEAFVDELRMFDFDVFFGDEIYDVENLPNEVGWIKAAVEDEIRNREVFLLVLTPAALASQHVQFELAYARTFERQIIPIVVKSTKVSEFPSSQPLLSTLSAIVAVGKDPTVSALEVREVLNDKKRSSAMDTEEDPFSFSAHMAMDEFGFVPERPSLPQHDDDSPSAAMAAISEPLPEELRTAFPPAAERVATIDTDLQITTYHRQKVAVQMWASLLVYVHTTSSMPKVRSDATAFKDAIGYDPQTATAQSPYQIPLGTHIVLRPVFERIQFDPEEVSFHWSGDWHRANFRFAPHSTLEGFAGNGRVDVYANTDVGLLLIASVRLAMLFGPKMSWVVARANAPQTPRNSETKTYLFRRLFISYAHEDIAVVEDCCETYKALGIRVLRDVETLLAGQNLDRELPRLIDTCDVFQLYWSRFSSRSVPVHKELLHALACRREIGFIRPLYWEEPMEAPPRELPATWFAKLRPSRQVIPRKRGWFWRQN